MANMGRSDGLRTIFSFFLGLVLTAFVGVGVYTFHRPPEQFDSQIRELSRREQAIRDSRPPGELSGADRDQIQDLSRRRDALADAATEARKPWGRSTSISLMVFATLIMAVSLVRADQLPVISNGLLLGGVFTMLYGVGWIVATDTSVTRFVVMAAAVAVTLALGYVRFVRRDASPAAGDGFTGLEHRVRDLEERMNQAAHALGRDRPAGR